MIKRMERNKGRYEVEEVNIVIGESSVIVRSEGTCKIFLAVFFE